MNPSSLHPHPHVHIFFSRSRFKLFLGCPLSLRPCGVHCSTFLAQSKPVPFLCDSNFVRWHLTIDICLSVRQTRAPAILATCRTWRFVLIRQMAPLYLHTLSVCHTRDPCLYGFILKCHLHHSHVRCALSLRIAKLLVPNSQERDVQPSRLRREPLETVSKTRRSRPRLHPW